MSESTERIIPFSFREHTNDKLGYLTLQIEGHCQKYTSSIKLNDQLLIKHKYTFVQIFKSDRKSF